MPEQVTVREILSKIRQIMEGVEGDTRSVALEDLNESVPSTPYIQVVFASANTDNVSEGTDRTSFRAGIRQTEMVFNVVHYSRPRSVIQDDIPEQVDAIDMITSILMDNEIKKDGGYLGIEGIKAFRWEYERGIVQYSGITYVAALFRIIVRVY